MIENYTMFNSVYISNLIINRRNKFLRQEFDYYRNSKRYAKINFPN